MAGSKFQYSEDRFSHITGQNLSSPSVRTSLLEVASRILFAVSGFRGADGVSLGYALEYVTEFLHRTLIGR
eukprot:2686403-Prymnesium_polylepis.1